MIFGNCGSLAFVIDTKANYNEALTKFKNIVNKAYKVNTHIKFEVFIHKVDGVSDDTKMESQRDIYQRASDDLAEVGLTRIHLSIHLTSIYDHSIFEAFSKVVQKLIPQLSTLENLLNIFISNSGIEKAFLFDVVSKIYIATYCSPVDIQSYELCCDMIDVVIYLSNIYRALQNSSALNRTLCSYHQPAKVPLKQTTYFKFSRSASCLCGGRCYRTSSSQPHISRKYFNFHNGSQSYPSRCQPCP